jgi:hypothetical protein
MNDWEVVEQEIRKTRGRVLGEAVWRRFAQAAGQDPKDENLAAERKRMVSAVTAALSTMDEAGFEGLETWLDMEIEFTEGMGDQAERALPD